MDADRLWLDNNSGVRAVFVVATMFVYAVRFGRLDQNQHHLEAER